MTPDIITSIISSLGVVGALVWYLYHNTTKTIPDLTEKYTRTNETIANKFTETLKEERAYRKEEIRSLQQWISSEAACRYNRDNPHEIKREHNS